MLSAEYYCQNINGEVVSWIKFEVHLMYTYYRVDDLMVYLGYIKQKITCFDATDIC